MTTARRAKKLAVQAQKVEAELIDISALTQLPDNTNLGTERGQYMLTQSVERVGLGRGVLLDKNNVLLGGNHLAQEAVSQGYDKVIVVDTDGKTLVATRRKDLDANTPRGIEASVWDNRVPQENINLDAGQLLFFQSNMDLPLELMYHEREIADMAARMEQATNDLLGDGADDEEGSEGGEAAEDEPRKLSRSDIPDAIWPVDNEWGIPTLDKALMADVIDSPAVVWGSQRRTARMRGTWFFYTEDYRYTALWNDPTSVVNSGCVSAVEPNFSCYETMPVAVALYRIYQKRWLARYWQSQGIRVLVDLNVAEEFYDWNLVGVPQGWKAWSTRGYNDRFGSTEREYEIACKHAGTDQILFVVYGGGKLVAQECGKRGWVHIREDMDRAKDGTKLRTDKDEEPEADDVRNKLSRLQALRSV